VLAKVTRDAIMTELHEQWPEYDFATHKGYVTPGHAQALIERGPCTEHRRRYVNVRAAAAALRGEQPMRDNILDETDVEIARLG
jgi:ribonuclease HII